jgi:putative tricarboxylic transport membrane protein
MEDGKQRKAHMLFGNMICGIVVSVFSAILFFYLQSQSLPKYGQEMSPNVWPSTLAFGLMILGGLVAIQYAVQLVKNGLEKKKEVGLDGKNNTLIMLAVILITTAYIISLKILGYILATYLYLLVSFYLLGVKEKSKLVFLPFLMVFLYTVSFVMVLYIPLPRGMGIFRTLYDFIQ